MTRDDKLLLLAYIDAKLNAFAADKNPSLPMAAVHRLINHADEVREKFLDSPDTLVRGRHFVGGDVGTINAPQFRERYRPTPNEGG